MHGSSARLPTKLRIPLKPNGPRYSMPTLCATNAVPHINAAVNNNTAFFVFISSHSSCYFFNFNAIRSILPYLYKNTKYYILLFAYQIKYNKPTYGGHAYEHYISQINRYFSLI